MFPATHIWFAGEVLGFRNSLTVLGSVFPDITISGFLDYESTHKGGWSLYNFIHREFPEYLDFVEAFTTHTVDPKGLDYYGDEEYGSGFKGYCFQKAEQIAEEVVKACNIPREYGLWKAHNFIEMGIEINVVEKNREITGQLYRVMQDEAFISRIAVPLGRFYGVRSSVIGDAIRKFSEFIELKDLNSRTLSAKYDLQMQAKHGIRIDVESCGAIIEKCQKIVRSDFDEFISFAIDKVKNCEVTL